MKTKRLGSGLLRELLSRPRPSPLPPDVMLTSARVGAVLNWQYSLIG